MVKRDRSNERGKYKRTHARTRVRVIFTRITDNAVKLKADHAARCESRLRNNAVRDATVSAWRANVRSLVRSRNSRAREG